MRGNLAKEEKERASTRVRLIEKMSNHGVHEVNLQDVQVHKIW